MVEEKKYNGISWTRLRDPNREEVEEIMRRYDIPPHVAEELRLPSQRQKADLHGHFFYAVFHFPLPSSKDGVRREIDFLVGKDFLVTAEYGSGDPLHEFSKLFEVNSLLGKSEEGEHAGHIFFYMLKHLYRAIERRLEALEIELEAMEAEIFQGREREMVRSLSETGRVVLDLRKALIHHEELLSSFIEGGGSLFGNTFDPYMKSLLGDFRKILLSAESSREFLDELRETNRTLLTSKQNETMKFFTVISFVTFPLALLVSLLTIDSPDNPLTKDPHEFLIILGIVAIVSLVLFAVFKRKRWI